MTLTPAQRMDHLVARSPGLQVPRLAVEVPGLPTLPDLKKLAWDRRAAGLPVIDQSAGDIADVGQPMSPDFAAWIEEARDQLVAEGLSAVARVADGATGYPGHYQQQYPAVTARLAASWGATGPVQALQTVSGRAVLDFVFRGLLAHAGPLSGQPAVVLDPLAWSGYAPLADDLGLALVHMPAVPGHGLRPTPEGLAAALDFARQQGLHPVGIVTIQPSNPTGEGLAADELVALAEAAHVGGAPLVIDAFYSPLSPGGHAEAVPMGTLERRLAPEVLGNTGLIVGETKVVSSQNKTGSVLWFAPAGHAGTATRVLKAASTRLKTTNCYPRPQEAVVAYALHTFPGGVQAAMGPRYRALDATRQAMTATAERLGLPLAIGGSFYGTLGLVTPDGDPLVRDADGRPLTDPRDVSQTLIERFGLVGAPGGMFSPAPEASLLVRLTAAVTPEDVAKVGEILETMLSEAAA